MDCCGTQSCVTSVLVHGNLRLFGGLLAGKLRSDAIDDLELESLAKDVDLSLETISRMLWRGMVEQVGPGATGALGS